MSTAPSTVCLHGTRVVGVLPGWQMNVNVNVNDVNSKFQHVLSKKPRPPPRCERDQSSHPRTLRRGCLRKLRPTGRMHISWALLLSAALAMADEQNATVLITGATGRTGSLLFNSLKAHRVHVRAFVRSAEKAAEYLNCSKCDESEGIYVGDVNDTAALNHAALGVSAVAICAGVSGNGSDTPEEIVAVEFHGVQNTLAALAQPANVAARGISGLRIVLLSSMGTTEPNNPDLVLFYKLQAEAFLGASGVPFAIVKPCGLLNTAGGSMKLLVGHDDTLLETRPPLISRADVAAVLEAALSYETSALRLDLCSEIGEPPTDLHALLDEARYPWQQTGRRVVQRSLSS